MHEPSDGIPEELERQLQLALAAAAVAARHAIAARQHQVEQAARDSEQAARQVKDRIDAERVLATARLRPVFDPGWWETAGPQDVADMWQEANTWRDPDRAAVQPTIFDHAADRIRQEVRDRSGLDPTQVKTIATVQELEREHQSTLAQPGVQPAAAEVPTPEVTTRHGFDNPQRREQLRTRLAAAGVPEPATEARTLADLGQAREPADAAQTPVAAASGARPAASRSARRELRRQR
jgi:hypothetical protein